MQLEFLVKIRTIIEWETGVSNKYFKDMNIHKHPRAVRGRDVETEWG